MGKYNFNYDRIKALETENSKLKLNNEQLSKAMETLAAEVVALKQAVAGKAPLDASVRTIYQYIDDVTMLDELFGVRPAEGDDKVIRDNESTRSNFVTFCRNILRAICPAVVTSKTTGSRYLGYTNLKDMTETEYHVATKLIADCVDLCYEAKKKIKEESK